MNFSLRKEYKMADLQIAETKTLKWEGGYCNVAGDRGGETIFGIARNMHPKLSLWNIMDTYKKGFESFSKANYKELEKQCLGNTDFKKQMDSFYREEFWDKIKGDCIESQHVANALYDFAVNSGVSRAVKSLQETLGVVVDGSLGNKTLEAINKQEGKALCNKLCDKRKAFFEAIAKKGQNAKFLNGWLNRVKDFYV